MKTKRSTIGYLIMEKCEDYSQALGLVESPQLPPGGVLQWTDGKRAIFPTRKQARAAIDRTEHYRLAWGDANCPERKFCGLEPVELITTPTK
jgi:hypothetical protein